jgi:hypothetical protein
VTLWQAHGRDHIKPKKSKGETVTIKKQRYGVAHQVRRRSLAADTKRISRKKGLRN